MSLTLEQYNELLSKITDKDLFDYISLLVPSGITLATLYWSHKAINRQAELLKDEKLFSKELEAIFETQDLLFNYFNASNLFFSLNEKEFNNVLKGSDIKIGEGKADESSEAFYEAITDFKRAAFLMRALGKEDIRAALDQYHSNCIALRKEVLKNRPFLKSSNETSSIRDLMNGVKGVQPYSVRVSNLEKEFNICVRSIASYKENLKRNDKS